MDFTTTPAHNPAGPKAPRWLKIAPIILLLIALAGASLWYYNKSSAKSPLPVNIVSSLAYPVYYPSHLPGGYSYTEGSSKVQTGLFYYRLHNGTKTITVTQQPVIGTIDLKKLPKYSSLDVPAGPAAIGVSVGNPSVVVATGATLVNINSSKGVSKDSVIAVARNMKAIDTASTN